MLAMIEKGDWLYSFDLKAGYHHVDICESYQTFEFFLQARDSTPACPKIVLVPPQSIYMFVRTWKMIMPFIHVVLEECTP